ncbi:uncharacterized protein EDB91DRAFT_894795 [Suillus paluster]|uniref:uncharacterized protein n=1 Tax=Suillus paluster TaxID=48578 RepID=UPI001B8675EE|nr:uncharacterized protein EDB91DRAFT_894795 [Suillus paluster]KAG1727154.1 hypothetical protein EDB91DRAFT_894795 [Suillus paluster]
MGPQNDRLRILSKVDKFRSDEPSGRPRRSVDPFRYSSSTPARYASSATAPSPHPVDSAPSRPSPEPSPSSLVSQASTFLAPKAHYPRDTYENVEEFTNTIDSSDPHGNLNASIESTGLGPSSGSMTPFKGPALNLHWQLLSYHVARPNLFLHFDVAFPTQYIEYRQKLSHDVQRTPLCDADLDKPAADMYLTEMIINFQRDQFKWDINVNRDEGIRVRDVFDAIYAAFDVPLTLHEQNVIPLRLRAGCDEAFRLRCNLAPVLPTVQQRQGLKRVDALLYGTLFRGLTQSKSGADWTLNLSGTMPRAKRDSDSKDKRDLLSDASLHGLETTASKMLSDSPIEHQYLPPYPDQTPNAPPQYSDIDLFNLPLSAAFVSSTDVDNDVMV